MECDLDILQDLPRTTFHGLSAFHRHLHDPPHAVLHTPAIDEFGRLVKRSAGKMTHGIMSFPILVYLVGP